MGKNTVKDILQDECPEWLFGRVMLRHNRDRKTVATERNPPMGSKHNMQDECLPRMREGQEVSKMGKERSQKSGIRSQNGAEYSKRHSARRVSKMSKMLFEIKNGCVQGHSKVSEWVSKMGQPAKVGGIPLGAPVV